MGDSDRGGNCLNAYLVVPHFKMETNRSTRASILPGVWSTSLDLADAYFHCPISAAVYNCLGMRQKNVWVEFLDKRIVQVGMNLDRQCVQMSLDNLNNLVKTKGAMANPNGRARN
jgi:hypothetical protein